MGGEGSTPVIIEEGRGFGQRNVVVLVQELGSGLPVAVRCLVLKHQHERLSLVSLVLHPFQCEVRDDVSRVANVFDSSVVFAVPVRILEHRRVVIWALANQHLGVVVSLWRHMLTQVPLADHSGGVADLAKELWKGLLRTVEFVTVD